MLFDSFANQSRLKHVHPGEKAVFTLTCLFLTLLFSQNLLSALIILLFSGLLTGILRIPAAVVVRLFLLPLPFLLPGVLAVALEAAPPPEETVFVLQLRFLVLGITRDSAGLALNLGLRSLAAVCSLYFLALSTPFNDLAWLLRRVKAPVAVVELAALIYRFIFVLTRTAEQIYTAQSSRLGYLSVMHTFRSLGILAASLLLKTCHRSRTLSQALESRCYDGEFKCLNTEFRGSSGNRAIIATTTALLLCAAVFLGGA
jgi:cobalt/nickel transport system permease protein